MRRDFDIIIIGTGAGGGTLAFGLKDSGANILLVERGGFLPREEENWQPGSVFRDYRYKTEELWDEPGVGPFRPGIHYFVGGNTKVYGAALPRMRREDFDAREHFGGLSPDWPISYDELEPYYTRAEAVYRVHGTGDEDPTDPPRNAAYPFPAVAHEPVIAELSERLVSQGLRPFHLPLGVDIREDGTCIRCATCDGFPCKVHAKSDAETCCVRPALESEGVRLMTGTTAVRLRTSGAGDRVDAVEVERAGERFDLQARTFVVSCGAVNSAALLLRSEANGKVLANASGQVGRNYMAHNNTAMIALRPFRHNDTVFQKTLAVNDYYFGTADWPFPMGNLQLIGKVQGAMLKSARPKMPSALLGGMADRSVDWWVMSEDLPDPGNRVSLGPLGRIQVRRTPNNLEAHKRLLDAATRMMREAGFPFVFAEQMGIDTNSHQCGTVRFGADGATSVLDPYCRAHDVKNLFVVDASFFPSSAAVNPALTIAAQALRVADHVTSTS